MVKGESRPAEIPSDEQVGAYCQAYRDFDHGIEGIPVAWWTGWLSNQLASGRPFPREWQRILTLAFKGDHAAGHPKALGCSGRPSIQKNAAVSSDGQSPAQRRFMLTRELEEVSRRLDECHELVMPPDPADARREKELKAAIAALGVQTTGGAQ